MKASKYYAYTDQFSRLEVVRKLPVSGVEAWTAVWANRGNHVAISAPTLDKLDEVYIKLTGIRLRREKAEHLVIIPYRESDSEAK